MIENNVAAGTWAYGVGIYSRTSNTEIVGNVIRGNISSSNRSWNYGGGILVSRDVDVQIVNNTIDGNSVGPTGRRRGSSGTGR